MPRTFFACRLPAAVAAIVFALGNTAMAAQRGPIPVDAPAFREAARLIESGRNYNAAADRLQGLIAKHPDNAEYHLALGCAYADRAASLAHALAWRQMLAEMTAQYPKDLADWKAAQSDPKADDYGHPMPVAPPQRVFATKDDGRPLTASDEQIVKSLNRLNAGAQQEWASAVRLSRGRTERANAEYTQGWGLLLLKRSERFDEDPVFAGLSLPKADPRDPFAAAVKDDPSRADYWQSLGDAIWSARGGDLFGHLSARSPDFAILALRAAGLSLPGAASNPAIMVAAYRKSLALQPHNATLWYRLSDLYGKDDPKLSQSALVSALREAPNAAVLHYWKANFLWSATPYEKIFNHDFRHDRSRIAEIDKESTPATRKAAEAALREMEMGNACTNFAEPEYMRPVPAYLEGGWAYGRSLEHLMIFPAYFPLRATARAAAGYAILAEFRKEPDEAMHAAEDTVKMGERVADKWPIRDSEIGSQDIIRTFVGIAIASIGYKAQQDISRQTGNSQLIARTDSAREQFDGRVKAYKAAMRSHIGEPSLLDSY